MLRGRLYDFATPRVMAIVNLTPDSFYPGSRLTGRSNTARRIEEALEQGADILDLGGYSSRPGAAEVSADEEYSRLASGLEEARRLAPEAILSIDTFRAGVAERCVREWGADIVNDISGGLLDLRMAEVCGEFQVPVIVMHMRGTPATMQQFTDYADPVADTITELERRVHEFRSCGVADVIIDPGFGFAKTTEQNYEIMRHLDEFLIFEAPLLVGISRKSMIYKPLDITPDKALTGTVALNMAALSGGADILRVHDVKEAVETVKIHTLLRGETL